MSIGVVIGVVSLILTFISGTPSLTLMNGIRATQDYESGPRPPPAEWGRPWIVGIQAGLDGTSGNLTNPDGTNLVGAGGPFPNVYLL